MRIVAQGASLSSVGLLTYFVGNAYHLTPLGVCILVVVGLTTALICVVALDRDVKALGRVLMLTGAVVMFGLTMVGLNEGLFQKALETPSATLAPIQVELGTPISIADAVPAQLVLVKQ